MCTFIAIMCVHVYISTIMCVHTCVHFYPPCVCSPVNVAETLPEFLVVHTPQDTPQPHSGSQTPNTPYLPSPAGSMQGLQTGRGSSVVSVTVWCPMVVVVVAMVMVIMTLMKSIPNCPHLPSVLAIWRDCRTDFDQVW